VKFAAAFDYDTPASALVKHLKYGSRKELAPIMASFMVLQLSDLDFPWPDALVPVPQSLPRRLVRGFNPAASLAHEMGRLMCVPVLQPLRRASSALPQASKTKEERTSMSQEFLLKPRTSLTKKHILLIDDVITTGTTVSRCSEALYPAYPSSIHALGFCIA